MQIPLLIGLMCVIGGIAGCTSPDHRNGPESLNNKHHPETLEEHCQTMPSMPGCEAYAGKSVDSTGSQDLHAHQGHTMDHGAMVTDVLSFIAEMIPHHQEAVDTSMIVLLQTSNPQLKTILQNIISGQSQEITMMQGRLSQYFSGEDYKPQYMLMMRPLTGLSGAELERVYMTDMITHHQGAVDMAHKILKVMEGQDPVIRVTQEMAVLREKIKKFAQDIITYQTQEIQEFTRLLRSTK